MAIFYLAGDLQSPNRQIKTIAKIFHYTVHLFTSSSRLQSDATVPPKYSSTSTTSTSSHAEASWTWRLMVGLRQHYHDLSFLGTDHETHVLTAYIQVCQHVFQVTHEVTNQHLIVCILKILDNPGMLHLSPTLCLWVVQHIHSPLRVSLHGHADDCVHEQIEQGRCQHVSLPHSNSSDTLLYALSLPLLCCDVMQPGCVLPLVANDTSSATQPI